MSKLAARLRYRILRSPIASLVKSTRRVSRGRALAQRFALAQELPVDAAIVEAAAGLGEQGYARLDEVVDIDCLDALERATRTKLAEGGDTALPDGVSDKAFWSRPLDADLVGGKIPLDTAFARFALQPRILSFLAESFGTLPLLDYVLLTVSQPSASQPVQSQLWHRDHDDTRTIKLFVYLTDVASREDGPFTFLPGRKSDAIGAPHRSHAPDSWMFARAETSDLVEMIAPRLSTFAVETSRCLHMGSRLAEGHERVLFTATFTTAPRIFGSGSRFVDAPDESELVRAVLGQEHI